MPRSLLNSDPELDLILERVVDVPRHLVWAAWTQPQHLMKWFCPLPWKTTACKIDLQPGGIFQTTMQGPEGPGFTKTSCWSGRARWARASARSPRTRSRPIRS
jgi:uncharacterized protein YndB with AHSA1/START domain